MVGQLEGQFLKMFVQTAKSNTVLDIGTFTGYSALSFAEGLPADGSVVTIEYDEKIAAVAKRCFDASAHASKIDLRVGDAPAILEDLASAGRKFDIVFIDADKDNYSTYYKLAMDGGLLADDGCILADNSLCALVYDKDDIRRQRLHEFNMMVANDERVEQTVLTVREGITLIRRKL
jgi:predicted O-methyltransferase YrrM